MDGVRVGRVLRAVRRRRRLTQADVAMRARVCQSTISRIERGDLGRLMVDTVAAVGAAVGVELVLLPRYRGAELDRLLDERHARIVEGVVAELRSIGWEVIVEYTFSHFGERGSVDVLAWHAECRALLIVEVKTAIADLQDLLAAQDRKVRLVPAIVSRQRGWQPLAVGRVLVVPDERTLRRRIAAHQATFDAALPARSREVQGWLRRPDRNLAGIWFLSASSGRRGRRG